MTTRPPSCRRRLVLASDPLSVRDGLRQLLALPPISDLSPEVVGNSQIVLAEILNNIGEHGYAERIGQIEVTLDYDHPLLCCEIVDTGVPMPEGRLPAGNPAVLGDLHDLPEGGFGWFLIRSLTRGLVYRHQSGRNMLAFWMDVA